MTGLKDGVGFEQKLTLYFDKQQLTYIKLQNSMSSFALSVILLFVYLLLVTAPYTTDLSNKFLLELTFTLNEISSSLLLSTWSNLIIIHHHSWFKVQVLCKDQIIYRPPSFSIFSKLFTDFSRFQRPLQICSLHIFLNHASVKLSPIVNFLGVLGQSLSPILSGKREQGKNATN